MAGSEGSSQDRHETPDKLHETLPEAGETAIKEQERLLPIANVGRIMKRILPPTAKVSKEAKETMQECVSEFISFVTGEASDRCRKERRKTVNGDDVCWALAVLGFDDYVEPMRRYLERYREIMEGEPGLAAAATEENIVGGGEAAGSGSSQEVKGVGFVFDDSAWRRF